MGDRRVGKGGLGYGRRLVRGKRRLERKGKENKGLKDHSRYWTRLEGDHVMFLHV